MCRRTIFLFSLILLLGLTNITSADLVAYWPLDEGSGETASDLTGNGHGGALKDGVAWETTDVHVGTAALSFDGTDDYVEVPDHDALDFSNGFTIAAWIKLSDAGVSGRRPIVSKEVSPDSNRGWEFKVNNGQLSMQLYSTAADEGKLTITGSATLEAGEWYHVAGIYNSSGPEQFYINGELDKEQELVTSLQANDSPVNIGAYRWNGYRVYFAGLIDDLQIHDVALSADEIFMLMTGQESFPEARNPSPKDGALNEDTWVSLNWTPGDFAISHDIYFGDSFEDVNNGVSGTFLGNQTSTFLVVGFSGFDYPDGLIPGTTYYWRIDEINDAEPNSPWRGDVWSFTIPSKIAYEPEPPDDARFIDPDVTLRWTAGFGAKLHHIYLGNNFTDVEAGASSTDKGTVVTTHYVPGTLEPEKTYYWRVDEFDAVATYKGNVWSFTTAKAGGGVKGQYYQGTDFGELILTRTDPQINFNWADAGPDPAVGVNNFSVRWTGEVEALFTETYTFHTNSDDGVRLWVDGQMLIDNWTDHGNTEDKGTIDLIAGGRYNIVMEYYEAGSGAVAELRWSSPHTPKQFIPQGALSLPVRASRSDPSNGAVDIKQTPILSWSPGDYAASHQVYFGTDQEAVLNANTGSPEYKGSQGLGSENYEPGKLEWDTTYYWRIDEVNDTNADSPWKGNLWSFTTGNFIVVDDMELYNDINEGELGSNRIYNAWVDGFDDPTNGSQVGHLDPPFYEENIVHSGNKSMPIYYENAVGKSEATYVLTSNRDWTVNGVNRLVIWYIGDAANAAEPMYIVLNGTAAVTNDNPNAAQDAAWTEWSIDLKMFADQGVNLTNVNSITLGFGNWSNPMAGGSGMVFFDDIRLYPPPKPKL